MDLCISHGRLELNMCRKKDQFAHKLKNVINKCMKSAVVTTLHANIRDYCANEGVGHHVYECIK